jgi:hypothetical protein
MQRIDGQEIAQQTAYAEEHGVEAMRAKFSKPRGVTVHG